ncbi:hypothetical protein FRACYDRAFT_248001 [Fragilariopsis cylindrus CCMP1102]|uniref:Uncharacterized protein n=1 Tax=Fragilariopsis cylindrus CCMP1102 TaxID=635003 RepID=A0A1E7EVA4_9STRA|nr:hypothetical protein FRACYDRAFT_248001 [Fragilariopsis cylindrus CCMP1102]|eukprot:OEU09744.1 hypothetical protein FRACYDRAFT_248001 [Fragilariopsis cylindrus CCMP1102]
MENFLTICTIGRYLGVETMVQFLFQTMACWPKKSNVCVLEARIRLSMRDHEPWFIPYGYWYGMDDWVVFWCTMLVLEPKEKNRKVVGGKHNVLVHYVNVCAPDPSGALSSATLVVHFDQKSCYYLFVGGKINALLHYVDVCAPDPSGVLSSATLPYEIFCNSSLIENLVVCVPSTTAKWIPIPQPQE